MVLSYPGIRVWRQPNDPEDLRRFTSAQAPTTENRYLGGNRSRYMNPAFDALIERYMSTIPLDARVELLGQIVHHMDRSGHDHGPLVQPRAGRGR